MIVENLYHQAEEAEKQMKLFKELLFSNLIKKGFSIKVIHDSIIILKEDKENKEDEK